MEVSRNYRIAAGATMLAGTLALFGASSANAAYSACRSDPVISLSNGQQMTLYEDISADPSQITGISYQLKLPVGVSVTSISYVGQIPANVQSVTVSSTNPANTYDDLVTVQSVSATGKPISSPVVAYLAGTSSAGTYGSVQVQGHTNQQLHIHVVGS
jgi:hypothetical protein